MLKNVFFAIICIAVANANRNNTAGCRLPPHPSVEYRCRIVDSNSTGLNIEGYRACNEHEPEGAEVLPECRAPNYYNPAPLLAMHCVSGSWDYVAICTPECGTITPVGLALSVSEPSEDTVPTKSARRGEVPWHAVVYSKTTVPYRQLCGGSLVSDKLVISAAHCFWDNVNGAEPASQYVVAVGKQFRSWASQEDDQAQTSDVNEISIPIRFFGSVTNYQDDIALLVLATPVRFNTHVRPVCLDFDVAFERRQLTAGNTGKIASWGPSRNSMQVVELPYVAIEQCISDLPVVFREYITSDKICAYSNDPSVKLCRGSTGHGLAFPSVERGVTRYYLRGVLSTASVDTTDDSGCSQHLAFTQVAKHEHFVKDKLVV